VIAWLRALWRDLFEPISASADDDDDDLNWKW